MGGHSSAGSTELLLKLLILTGWYCSEAPRGYETHGVDEIRGAGFRSLWAQSLERALPPNVDCSLLTVDSASPVPPPTVVIKGLTSEVVIRLAENPGHAQHAVGHFCGCTVCFLLGLQYAESSSFDALVYVEQDALLSPNAISYVLDGLQPNELRFGRALSKRPKWAIQQSLFAVGSQRFRPFAAKLMALDRPDRELAPELKFCVASSPWWVIAFMHGLSLLLGRQLFKVFARSFYKLYRPYRFHPVLGGRDRPLDWGKNFYFQHATAAEIERYRSTFSTSESSPA